jgi:hypothetical protein
MQGQPPIQPSLHLRERPIEHEYSPPECQLAMTVGGFFSGLGRKPLASTPAVDSSVEHPPFTSIQTLHDFETAWLGVQVGPGLTSRRGSLTDARYTGSVARARSKTDLQRYNCYKSSSDLEPFSRCPKNRSAKPR